MSDKMDRLCFLDGYLCKVAEGEQEVAKNPETRTLPSSISRREAWQMNLPGRSKEDVNKLIDKSRQYRENNSRQYKNIYEEEDPDIRIPVEPFTPAEELEEDKKKVKMMAYARARGLEGTITGGKFTGNVITPPIRVSRRALSVPLESAFLHELGHYTNSAASLDYYKKMIEQLEEANTESDVATLTDRREAMLDFSRQGTGGMHPSLVRVYENMVKPYYRTGLSDEQLSVTPRETIPVLLEMRASMERAGVDTSDTSAIKRAISDPAFWEKWGRWPISFP